MPVTSLETANPITTKDQLILADTSFVIATVLSHEPCHVAAKNFLEVEKANSILCINVTIRQELLKRIRHMLIRQHVRSVDMGLAVRLKNGGGDWGKQLVWEGRSTLVEFALKGKLQSELNRFQAPFVYYPGEDKAKGLKWEDVSDLMQTLLLDSADAMILNFALKIGFHGLVTCDKDYYPAGSHPDFYVYMPQKIIDAAVAQKARL